MKPTNTFRTCSAQPFLSKTFQLLLFLLPLIVFTVGDKAGSDGNSAIQVSSTSTPTSELQPSSLLAPQKLTLFAKALHKIAQTRCPKLDILELDTFQAYLNRQILNGDVQTLRHPLHFNSLYQALTGCANFLSSASALVPDHYLDDHRVHQDADGDGERSNKRSFFPTFQTDDDMRLSISSSMQSPPFGLSSTFKKGDLEENRKDSITIADRAGSTTETISGDDLPLTRASGTITSPTPTRSKSQKPPKDATRSNIPNTTPSTVIDKMVANIADTTTKVLKSTGNFFRKAFFQGFGRKKRDLFKVEEASEENDDLPSYSRLPRSQVKTLDDNTESDNNNNDVLKSATAAETRMTAYGHIIILLKSLITVAVDSCPNSFQIEEVYLSQICELMIVHVMKDLMDAEEQGMMMKVNEKLEQDLQLCADDLSARKTQQ